MAPEPAARRGNVFTRRIGPLPMWVWLVIVAVIVIGWAYWRSRQSAGQTSTSTATGTDASQVPQFVNQTYTTVQPPSVNVGGAATDTHFNEESEESDADTDDAQKKRKRPVNRRHPTHHKPKRKPVPPPRVIPGGPVRWVTPPVKPLPYKAA